jgi:exopolysaccharide biosynthesis WecB/TagA/CpsF family protein
MKIAILGLRGLPSTYSGFEAFISELGPRLVQRGHEVTVYCRAGLFPEKLTEWEGIQLRYISSIEHKVASTLSHSLLSIIDASFGSFDLVFVVNAANGMFGFIPRLAGRPCILNVDGMEWLRPKWKPLARWVFKNSAWLGCRFYNRVVTDAEEMHRLYAADFGIDTDYIAYGANIEISEHPEVLEKYGLVSDGYYLIASRLVPDNNADLIVREFVKSGSSKILAIAGGADYRGNRIEQQFLGELKRLANDRVVFLGHVGAPGHIKELHCHCAAYIHGHQFGGINPSILKALGYGNCILALDTPFNSEVLDNGRYGLLWKKNEGDLAGLINKIEADDALRKNFQQLAPGRIRERFTWEQITSQYEVLFSKVVKKDAPVANFSVPPRINVLGVGVHALNPRMAVAVVEKALKDRAKGYICVTGVHGVSEAQSDPHFRAILNGALLNTPDGMPMVWAGRWTGFRQMERVYGPDLLIEVCRASEKSGWKHFFYGGAPGTADALAAKLRARFPKLRVVGAHTPPFRPLNPTEMEELQTTVSALQPDIIWVGLSTPKQERFMAETLSQLDVSIMVGIGAAFDLVSGKVRQSPRWIQRSGFEWLYRLFQEPRRLWKRYLKNNPLFVCRFFLQLTRLKHYSLDSK